MRGLALLAGVLTAVACLAAGSEADALDTTLHSQYLVDTIPNDKSIRTHNLVLLCSDDALVYKLSLTIADGDASDTYRIPPNSIAVGHRVVDHPPYHFGMGGGSLDVLRWNGHTSGLAPHSYPLALPESVPLVLPVRVLDLEGGADAVVALDMVYTADAEVACSLMAGLAGPQRVGLVVPGPGPLAGIGAGVAAATMAGAEDFNAYLEDAGEPWMLDLVTAYDGADPALSLEAAMHLHRNGISVLLGPVTDEGLASVREYAAGNGMLVLSCCSSAGFVAAPDSIFRLAPDGLGQAEALSRLLAYDQVHSIVLVYDGGSVAIKDALADHLDGRVGLFAVEYRPGSADHLAQQILLEVKDVSDMHGVKGAGVVVAGSGDVVDVIRTASSYEMLRDVRWYGLGTVVGLEDLIHGDLRAFSEEVRMTGTLAVPAPGTARDAIDRALQARAGAAPGVDAGMHLYSAYDAVWVLGRAMMASQDASQEALARAIPVVASHYPGATGDLTLDENGDVAGSHYGIWRVVGGEWVRVGTYSQLTQSFWFD